MPLLQGFLEKSGKGKIMRHVYLEDTGEGISVAEEEQETWQNQ